MQVKHEPLDDERDRLVSFTEALAVIGVSRSTAYRLIAEDALPRPVKIGALTFFSERELQGWISEKLAARNEEQGST